MSLFGILERLGDGLDAIPVFQRNRCLRSRFSRSGCMRCIDSCPKGALAFDKGTVSVDERSCTGCLVCTSACPSGGLSWKSADDFRKIIAGMSRITNPVLACDRHSQFGYGTVPCLGVLSPQHMLYLGAMGHGRFQLDGQHCENCENGAVLARVEENLARLAEKLDVSAAAICLLAKRAEDLRLGEHLENRRHFLGGLKRMMTTKVMAVLAATPDAISSQQDDLGVWKKGPDGKTELLTHAQNAMASSLRHRISGIFHYQLRFHEECNQCGGCAAICPNGALKAKRAGAAEKILEFESAACCGCRLCVDFCRRDALEMHPYGLDKAAARMNQANENLMEV